MERRRGRRNRKPGHKTSGQETEERGQHRRKAGRGREDGRREKEEETGWGRSCTPPN